MTFHEPFLSCQKKPWQNTLIQVSFIALFSLICALNASDLIHHRLSTSVVLKTALQSYAAARGLVSLDLEPIVSQELRAIKECIMEAFDVAADGSKITTKRRMRWNSKDLASGLQC